MTAQAALLPHGTGMGAQEQLGKRKLKARRLATAGSVADGALEGCNGWHGAGP